MGLLVMSGDLKNYPIVLQEVPHHGSGMGGNCGLTGAYLGLI